MEHNEFRTHIREFTSTQDPDLHNQVIVQILDMLDLDLEYKKIRAEGGIERVLNIFSSFSYVPEDELISEYEKSSLDQVGEMTREFFAEGNFLAFAQMVLAMTTESLAEKYTNLSEDELNIIEISKIYPNIPEEIYLQTFLLETMADGTKFNWDRDEQIIEQSLLVLTVCFSDIYDFIASDEFRDEEIAG